MAYFNHAYQKMFIGTGADRDATSTGGAETVSNPFSDGGFVTTSGMETITFAKEVGPGYFGMFDSKTFKSLSVADLATAGCCPLVLVSASIHTEDKISDLIGGNQESNKSKSINPKYVRKFFRVDAIPTSNMKLHFGHTGYTNPNDTDDFKNACCKTFYCGEDYSILLQLRGDAVYRALNRTADMMVTANGGCCDDSSTAKEIDSTLIFLDWARQITDNVIFKDFVKLVVYDQSGTAWYHDASQVPTGTPATQIWDNYVSPGYSAGTCAGMEIIGAYVSTKFGNCSFNPKDYTDDYDPIEASISLVNKDGSVCEFDGICSIYECKGVKGQGFGTTMLKELILSESYSQRYFSNDARINEILGGTDVFNVLDKSKIYYTYNILHSVPRFNNPTGVFDNDQYMLTIVTDKILTSFETFMSTWLTSCGNGCADMEIITYAGC